ncbi:dihydrofolate reductase family protein [Nocardia beijingensis]|uniref:dihydrofolate reductase family protein n=1 Tax=Nocardia beijingensis TaxID=95162 RepID=UPI003331AFC4
MSRIIAVEHLTLDGVMQAPGRADEDTRDGFPHGGWAHRHADPEQAQFMGRHMAANRGALLLGRRTYEDFAGYWPRQTGDPMADALDKTEKIVASRTGSGPLAWQNSTWLGGDAATAVPELRRRQPDRNLVVLGSGELVRSLLRHDLIDEYLLLIHPLVLGTGRRLFDGVEPVGLRPVETVVTGAGVVITTYRRGGERTTR